MKFFNTTCVRSQNAGAKINALTMISANRGDIGLMTSYNPHEANAVIAKAIPFIPRPWERRKWCWKSLMKKFISSTVVTRLHKVDEMMSSVSAAKQKIAAQEIGRCAFM
jgi:hypothetical protein